MLEHEQDEDIHEYISSLEDKYAALGLLGIVIGIGIGWLGLQRKRE